MVWWTPGWKFLEKLLIIKQGDKNNLHFLITIEEIRSHFKLSIFNLKKKLDKRTDFGG